MANDKPVTRKERFLAGAAGEDITLDAPITREERFLAKAAGMDVKTDAPVTRSEKYLAKIAEGGGGGGGSVPEYEGSYSVTPSEQTQTLDCDGKKMTDDVTVGAISSTYIGSGITQKAAATYTPTTSDQTIAANQYLSGAQTVKGDANLVAGNIKKDVQMFGVTGTYEGGGSTPTGTITIQTNGIVDVSSYEYADVSVSGGGTEPKIDVISVADGLTNPTITQSELYAYQVLGDYTCSITDHRISYIVFDDVLPAGTYTFAMLCVKITQTATGYTAIFSTGGRDTDNVAQFYEAVLSYSSAQNKITVDSITYQQLAVRGAGWGIQNIKSGVSSVKLVSIKLD